MAAAAVCFNEKDLKSAADSLLEFAVCVNFTAVDSKFFRGEILHVKSSGLNSNDLLTSFKSSFTYGVSKASVNDSFKFVVVPLIEIVDVLERLPIGALYLYGGADTLPSLSVVMADNVESSRRVFTKKSIVLNALLKQWADSKCLNVVWKKEAKLYIKSLFFIRCVVLWLATFFSEIRYVRFKSVEINGPVMATFRKAVQAYSLYDYLDKSKEQEVTVFGNAKVVSATGIISHNYQSINLFIRSLTYSLKGLTQVFFKSLPVLTFHYRGVTYNASGRATLIEELCLLDQLGYKFFLEDALRTGITTFYSTEMTSRFAVIEHEVCVMYGVKNIGIQCGLMSGLKVPYFPLHNKFICLSESELRGLNESYGNGLFFYEGMIRKITMNKLIVNDVLLLSQPYAQNEIQTVLDLMNKKFGRFKCVLRIHPRDTFKYQLGANVTVDDRSDCWESVLESRIILGMTTTVLEDAVNAGKLSISFQFDEYSKGIASKYSVGSGAVCYDLQSLEGCLTERLLN